MKNNKFLLFILSTFSFQVHSSECETFLKYVKPKQITAMYVIPDGETTPQGCIFTLKATIKGAVDTPTLFTLPSSYKTEDGKDFVELLPGSFLLNISSKRRILGEVKLNINSNQGEIEFSVVSITPDLGSIALERYSADNPELIVRHYPKQQRYFISRFFYANSSLIPDLKSQLSGSLIPRMTHTILPVGGLNEDQKMYLAKRLLTLPAGEGWQHYLWNCSSSDFSLKGYNTLKSSDLLQSDFRSLGFSVGSSQPLRSKLATFKDRSEFSLILSSWILAHIGGWYIGPSVELSYGLERFSQFDSVITEKGGDQFFAINPSESVNGHPIDAFIANVLTGKTVLSTSAFSACFKAGERTLKISDTYTLEGEKSQRSIDDIQREIPDLFKKYPFIMLCHHGFYGK